MSGKKKKKSTLQEEQENRVTPHSNYPAASKQNYGSRGRRGKGENEEKVPRGPQV